MRPSITPTLNGDLLKRANLFRFIREFLQSTNMPKGYYMEFGVLNGEAMIDAYRQFRGVISHYYGFDSFEGLPEPNATEKSVQEYTPHFVSGNLKSVSMEFVRNNVMSCSRMSSEELTLVPGFFSESLPKFEKKSLEGVPLVLYIDCDLYSSTKEVLSFINDLAVTGTWILFDDYWFYRGSPLHGEQRAIQEWLNETSRLSLSPYENFNGFGKAFIAYEK